jgi:hypothetical protein
LEANLKFTFIDSLKVHFAIQYEKESQSITAKVLSDTKKKESATETIPLKISREVLSVTNFPKETKPLNLKSKILLISRILSKRGLTRWTCLNILGLYSENFKSAASLPRWKLLEFLFRTSGEWLSTLPQHIEIRFASETDLAQALALNHEELMNFVQPFNFVKDKTYIVEDLKLKLSFTTLKQKKHMNFTERFIIANPSIFIQYVIRFIKNDDLYDYLKENYQQVFQDIKKYRYLPYRYMDKSDRTFDELLSNSDKEKWTALSNVELFHQRLIVVKDEFLIPDITMDPTLKFIGGLWQFVRQAKPKSMRCVLRVDYEKQIKVETGMILAQRLDENWYHLLLDSVPRLYFMRNLPKEIPLLIRADLPNTSKEFLCKISGRKVIEIPTGTKVDIQTLYIVSARSTIFDTIKKSFHRVPKFSQELYSKMGPWILSHYGKEMKSLENDQRLSIPRLARYRLLLNSDKVSKISKEFGFEEMRPDYNFFKLQMCYFGKASAISAPGGAMLANMIFMKPGSSILTFRSFRNPTLHIWKELAIASNLKYFECVGIPTYFGLNKIRRIHSDYYISPKKVRRMFSSFNA